MAWQTPQAPHAQQVNAVLDQLQSSAAGLSTSEARTRLLQAGPNKLPEARPEGMWLVFFRQFKSPLIYILLAAAALSIFIGEMLDATFIFIVLVLNAAIGAVQEYNAEQSAQALRSVLTQKVRVRRDDEIQIMDFTDLVPGDVVLLESGDKVPADMRLLDCRNAIVDESLLTGESVPVSKSSDSLAAGDSVIADQDNMLFAGTIFLRGRAEAVVVATALHTKIGTIVEVMAAGRREQPPLMQRMERMTRRIGTVYIVLIVLMVVMATVLEQDFVTVLLVAVALAVAAIPEGLPVAITVALSVGMRRMARNNVIIRRLVAAETLGSCTYIASDKTGTLTVNEMTVRQLWLPGNIMLEVTGEGLSAEGKVHLLPDTAPVTAELVLSMARAAAFCNEAHLYEEAGMQKADGDPVDVALLVLARKAGYIPEELVMRYELLGSVPFEPENRFAASLHSIDGLNQVSVKGAVEQVMSMCSEMLTVDGAMPLDREPVEQAAQQMAANGYRVLALAAAVTGNSCLEPDSLSNLRFLGLVGMIDPPRREARAAIAECRKAGIKVAMVTGDHPLTAVAIARHLGMIEADARVLTGSQLSQLRQQGEVAFDNAVVEADIFARVEPTDKLDIVKSLSRRGHYVAVTGDGANDAPALRNAHVGVAMGKQGTDVARESAELVLTDDNFASLVEGIRQGRIAYNNIRKVVFLLISTGIAEVMLFFLCLSAGMPLPFTAVQLLWLNLVTEGIQHVGLAFEKSEGGEMEKPPRNPKEPIFNRIMIERTVLSASVMAIIGFLVFRYLLSQGVEFEVARNYVLLLMVLFENVHVINSRSEQRSIFAHSLLSNPLLLFGTLMAQVVHILAMYTPGLNTILDIQPVSLEAWFTMFGYALILMMVMEIHKMFHNIIAGRKFREPGNEKPR